MIKTILAAIALVTTAAYAVNQEEYEFANLDITNIEEMVIVASHTVPAFDPSAGTYYGIKFYVDAQDPSSDIMFGHVTLEAIGSPVSPYNVLPHMYCGFEVEGYAPVDVVYDYTNPLTAWDGVQTTTQLIPGVPQTLSWFVPPRIITSAVFIGGTDIGKAPGDWDFDFIKDPKFAVAGGGNGTVHVSTELFGFSGNVRMNYVYFPVDQDDDGVVGFTDLVYVLSNWGGYDGHDNEVLLSVLAAM